jgi:hypothetical protein
MPFCPVSRPGSDQDIHRAKLLVEFKYRLGINMQLLECENVYIIMVALIDGVVKQGRHIYDRIKPFPHPDPLPKGEGTPFPYGGRAEDEGMPSDCQMSRF